MSQGKEDPVHLSKDAALLHHTGALAQCVARLKLLQTRLLESDRCQLNASVLWDLCGIIRGEEQRWAKEGTSQPSVGSLEVVSCALCCLRNTTPNCARNQLLVAETEELLNPIISCLQWTFKIPEPTHPVADNLPEGSVVEAEGGGKVEDSGDPGCEWKKGHSTLALSCVTCLGNLVAANSKARRIVWPHLKLILEDVLVFRDEEVAQASTMVLHNCLLEAEVKEELCKCPTGKRVLKHLLALYETETKYSCFVLLSLEVLVTGKGLLEEAWESLSENHQQLCLEAVEAGLTNASKPLSGPQGAPCLKFLVGVFKNKADYIFRTQTNWMNPESAQVLARLGSFVCGVAASDVWRPTLQQDRSLLVSSVALLQCMSNMGKLGDNAFTPLDRFSDMNDEPQMTKARQHPAFGFKCDLLRLIASLVHLNPANQDLVRDMDGLLLILQSSKFDARNPLIKEVSIFALRNLLEGNLENQRCIEELQMKGVAASPGLAEMGMEARQEGGKLKLVQRPRSSPPDSPPEL